MALTFSLFDGFGALNSAPIFDAFRQGALRHNHRVSFHDMTADVAVIWSRVWAGRMKPNQAVWKVFQSTQRPVVTLEVGVLDRGNTWKVIINDNPYINPNPNPNPNRVQDLKINAKPWRDHGRDIVICLQRGDSHQWNGMPPVGQWCSDVIDELRRYTDRPISVRCHPRFPVSTRDFRVNWSRPARLAGTYDSYDLEKSFENAHAVINWNSSPGITAALCGIPVFVSPSSLAAEIGNTGLEYIEHPRMPDRSDWINRLCWTEWLESEIRSGMVMEFLQDNLVSGVGPSTFV